MASFYYEYQDLQRPFLFSYIKSNGDFHLGFKILFNPLGEIEEVADLQKLKTSLGNNFFAVPSNITQEEFEEKLERVYTFLKEA